MSVPTFIDARSLRGRWLTGLASPGGGAILAGHPVEVGELIQITGAVPISGSGSKSTASRTL